ncbi:MAG: TraM recognition domain-containing protein [Bdellovibrionota bacterium]
MNERLPLLTAAGLALSLAMISWAFHIHAISYAAMAIGVLAAAAATIAQSEGVRSKRHAVTFGACALEDRDFCRHGIVVGQPGTGKTELLKRILSQLMINRPNFGAIMTDEKGDLHGPVSDVCAANNCSDKLVVMRPRKYGIPGEIPKWRMNLIGDRSISWQSHAQLIVDTAISQGQKTSQAHFKTQALDRIAEAMETLHLAGSPVTLDNVYEFIKDPQIFDSQLGLMMNREANPDRANILYDGWKQYLAKAPEELSGIRGTIENYLGPYIEPEIAETFCAPEPTVEINDLDKGKILFISIPQQYTRARKHVMAFAKILYYRDSLGRFDNYDARGFDALNMHVGLFDEGQNSLLASEDGYSDYNTLDKMRSAKCPVWFMMQCYTSATPVLQSEAKVKVLKANIGTHVIFRLASEDGRKLASQVIGEHEVMEKSHSRSKGVTTTSISPKVKPVLGTWVFRKLPDFYAIIKHPTSQRDFFRVHLPPLTDDGKRRAPWYWKYRLKQSVGFA